MKSKVNLLRIEDFADVKSGKRLPKGHTLTSKITAYPYIRLVDVKDGKIRHSNIQYLKNETRKIISRYIINTNDVCLAIVGHTIGMVFQVDAKWDNANLTENSVKITNFTNKVDSKYLYYFLISSIGQHEIISRKVGSAQGKLPMYNIKSLEVPIPPLPIQKKIAHILSILDDKIELNRKMNQTLEEMTQALFKSWFVDFDPVHARANSKESDDVVARELGISEEALKLFPSVFVESELGLIPEGWEVSTIGKEFNVTMGQSPSGKSYNEVRDGMIFFQGRRDFGEYYPSERVYTTEPKRMAEKNDILLSVRAPVGDINIAIEKCCIGRGLASLKHKSNSVSYGYITIKNLHKYFKSYNSEGTVFGSINQKNLKSLAIVKNDNIMKKFDEIAEPLFQQIKLNGQEIQTLQQTRDTLLPKLLSRELDVSKIEVENE